MPKLNSNNVICFLSLFAVSLSACFARLSTNRALLSLITNHRTVASSINFSSSRLVVALLPGRTDEEMEMEMEMEI